MTCLTQERRSPPLGRVCRRHLYLTGSACIVCSDHGAANEMQFLAAQLEPHRRDLDMTVHAYFIDKAARAFAAAGGDPANSGQLAAWAEELRDDQTVHGVIVAADGEIMASTWRSADQVGAIYVDEAGRQRWNLRADELGLALARIRRESGKPCIHVTKSSVCLGAGSKPATTTDKAASES